MKFSAKLRAVYGLLLCLTAPVFIYAFSCHIMWVCCYAVLMVFVTILLSALMMCEMKARQRRLTSDVAHELRTPLACLQGSMEALIDGMWEPTPERLADCSEEIERLTKLVSDLSLLTDIEWEHIQLDKSSFDLAALLETTAEQFQGETARKGIALIVDAEPQMIHADYNRIKQVFINLVSNALKYTDSGSVTIGNRGREAFVSDTGSGIEPEALPHVFERFYRADSSRARSTGGSGVGLTIARALMRAHNGSIRAESEPGRGSVFRVMF